MSLPYPEPDTIFTKLRCKYSLPGRKYDCRRIGKYLMDGKGFCAPHYDARWKALHPVLGQSHDWHRHVNRFTGAEDHYESCRRCGHIRQLEGLAQGPCDGVMPEIVLRGVA